MSLINYQGDSKILKRICQLLKVTDVQDGEGHSLVDSDGIAVVTGGGGGSSTLAGLSDVDTTGASAGDVLALNGTTNKWEDKTLATVASSGSYNDLTNKPTIPAAQVNSDWNASSGVAQILNKPTALSSFTNDQGFITSSVNNLTNYYLKSETYTKAEVNTLIGQISTISILVVQSLPTTDIQTNIIYLVPKSTAGTSNAYDEYINTDGTSAGWELIGDTEVDLSNYYTKTEVDALIPDDLDDLSDVSLSSPTSGQAIMYNGTNWVNSNLPNGGHTIKNDAGTALAQKSNLKFAGVYSANSGDDSVVNIVREMLEDDYDLLSANEKKGFIYITDETDDALADVAVTGEYSDVLNRPIMGANTFKVTRGQSQSTSVSGYWAAMVHRTGGGNPTTPANGWWHVISMDWDANIDQSPITNWCSQLALATQDNSGVWYRKNTADTNIDSASWTRLADADANGYANVANLLNGFINPCGADNNGSATFTYDFYANRMYIVTLGGVGGGGARFLNGSVYLVWCNENNTTGSLVVSALRTGSYSISSSARAQSGTNKFTLTANTSVRWNVYPFLVGG